VARLIERALRRILPFMLPYAGFEAKMDLAAGVLADCGFGSGAAVGSSNEAAAFEVVRRSEPVLVDVGAHRGEYALAFLSRFGAATVYCIEPVAAHFQLLTEAMQQARQQQSRNDREAMKKDVNYIHLAQLALGNHPGEAILYRNRHISGLASFSKRRMDHFAIAMDIEERVKVTTLDKFASDFDIEFIDLLKLDVEGHELAVLDGASKLFSQGAIAAVQFEFGGCNLDSRTTFQDFYYFFVKEHGFSIYIINRYGLQQIIDYSELHEHYRTTNFIAVRRP
jgi:FkbM family methyltransferase